VLAAAAGAGGGRLSLSACAVVHSPAPLPAPPALPQAASPVAAPCDAFPSDSPVLVTPAAGQRHHAPLLHGGAGVIYMPVLPGVSYGGNYGMPVPGLSYGSYGVPSMPGVPGVPGVPGAVPGVPVPSAGFSAPLIYGSSQVHVPSFMIPASAGMAPVPSAAALPAASSTGTTSSRGRSSKLSPVPSGAGAAASAGAVLGPAAGTAWQSDAPLLEVPCDPVAMDELLRTCPAMFDIEVRWVAGGGGLLPGGAEVALGGCCCLHWWRCCWWRCCCLALRWRWGVAAAWR